MAQALALLGAFVSGFLAGWKYASMKSSKEQSAALARSAEQIADSSLRVEAEARKTGEAVAAVGPATSAADGSKILSGG